MAVLSGHHRISLDNGPSGSVGLGLGYRGETAREWAVSKLWDRLEGCVIGELCKSDAIAGVVCAHPASFFWRS